MFKCLETREKGVQGVVWHIQMAPEAVMGQFGEVRVREFACCMLRFLPSCSVDVTHLQPAVLMFSVF